MPTAQEVLEADRNTGEISYRMRFGGGIHSLKNIEAIDALECVEGSNFRLGLDDDDFSGREPFDKIGTAPNGAEVGGLIEHIQNDGTTTELVQAGGNVYSFDGDSTFVLVGTCNAGSRLRGGRFSTSAIDGFVIITDLDKLTVVKNWNGTTFADLAHNLGGQFFAKYCLIDHERAFYLNAKAGATDTPHLLLGSGRGTTSSTSAVATLSVANRPASSLSVGDPFFIPMPNMKPINGVVNAFGEFIISTENGDLFKLSGTTAKDFEIDSLLGFSGAQGDEPLINVGNDLLYGRHGKIDSVIGIQAFGDVETDDVSRWIADEIENVTGWQTAFNPRTKKAYFWPELGNEVYVFNNDMHNPLASQRGAVSGLSPWSKFTTTHGNQDFRTKVGTLIRRPTDKIDVVQFGGPAGEIYQFGGTGSQDGGDSNIAVERLSGAIEIPHGELLDFKGYIKWKKAAAITVTITFEFSGEGIFNESITVSLPAIIGGSYFGGDAFFGGDVYFGVQFEKRLSRVVFDGPGRGDLCQIRVSVTGDKEFSINEIGFRFKAASKEA